MSTNIVMSDKKKALIAHKEKILRELAYYESRIEEINSSRTKISNLIEDIDSSDSEPEFPLTLDLGPSTWQLKEQQSSLKTCLQATQELTSLQVLQSEVNVLVDDPVIEGEPPAAEKGAWREVTAECKVDLVPFSISFYVHQPSRKFAPRHYRSVRTVAVRAPHAAELDNSVLPAVSTPSDAVEVLKNYSSAHRSRRSTLARLATKYNDALHMEPMPEGGYLLKCANLLEVSWMLQNKWSPIAPFHHRMKFNLEYMDESYIKIITQAHRQLSDPTIETDERTFLLSKIISTCLEAQGPTQELYESMSSDPETTQSLKKQRTTLYQEPEQPIVAKNKSKEVMAPPKSLPKKTKPKGKENVVENRKSKRITEDTGIVKKAKDQNNELLKSVDNISTEVKSIDENNKHIEENTVDKVSPKNKEGVKANIAKPKKSESIKKPVIKSTEDKTNEKKVKTSTNDKTDSDKNDVRDKPNTKNEKTKDAAKVKKTVENIATNKDVNKAKDVASSKKIVSSDAKEVKSTKATHNNENTKKALTKETLTVEKSDKIVKNKVAKPTNKEKINNNTANKDKINKNKVTKPTNKEQTNNNDENKEKVKLVATKQKNTDENTNKTVKNVVKENNNVNKDKPKSATTKTQSTDKNKIAKDKVKSVASTNKVTTNVEQGLVKNKVDNAKTKPVSAKQNKPIKSVENKIVSNEETNQNINKETTIDKAVEKNVHNLKRKSNLADGDTNVAITKKTKLSEPESSQKQINNGENKLNKPQNVKTSSKVIKKVEPNKPKFITNSMKTLKTGNIHRAFNAGNISKQSSDKPSRIPQKKLSSASEATLKKNPLRISPRKIPSKFKRPAPFGNKYTMVQKTTSIPRFMKKPSPKT